MPISNRLRMLLEQAEGRGAPNCRDIYAEIAADPDHMHELVLLAQENIGELADVREQNKDLERDIREWERANESLSERISELTSRFHPAVEWFAEKMNEKLIANAHKGTWVNEAPEYLMRRLEEELAELRAIGTGVMGGCTMMARAKPHDEKHRHSRAADVVSEAADVANFAMMVADVCAHPLYGNRRLEAITSLSKNR